MKGQVLAALAAVGLAVAVSSCSGSPAPASSPSRHSPPASNPANAAPAPAGYQRIGGAAQGIALDIPSSWVTVDFSQEGTQQAIKRLGLTGAAATAFSQTMGPLVKEHAAYAADTKGAGTTPGHFVTNINAYCTPSGVTLTGSSAVAALKQSWASQMQQLGGRNVSQVGSQIGGVAGEETSYTLTATSSITLYATQVEVLPKSGTSCYFTLTAAGSMPTSVLDEVIATVQYP
jgi:hypothetical protein